MNSRIPLFVAGGIGVMSGFYIWQPLLEKYKKDSNGTFNYEVVQQTRSQELNNVADAVASSIPSTAEASPATPVTSEQDKA